MTTLCCVFCDVLKILLFVGSLNMLYRAGWLNTLRLVIHKVRRFIYTAQNNSEVIVGRVKKEERDML